MYTNFISHLHVDKAEVRPAVFCGVIHRFKWGCG